MNHDDETLDNEEMPLLEDSESDWDPASEPESESDHETNAYQRIIQKTFEPQSNDKNKSDTHWDPISSHDVEAWLQTHASGYYTLPDEHNKRQAWIFVCDKHDFNDYKKIHKSMSYGKCWTKRGDWKLQYWVNDDGTMTKCPPIEVVTSRQLRFGQWKAGATRMCMIIHYAGKRQQRRTLDPVQLQSMSQEMFSPSAPHSNGV